ncbi:hypothetical protein BKA70DRAFT_1401158 [Coprinopsis sp. MPI-PUGE-AT-0042]|nr:hypothetical protein BKA70DRAFT_1401158 [Coprinopsis sp. MPI-PUGE-AT-0042]
MCFRPPALARSIKVQKGAHQLDELGNTAESNRSLPDHRHWSEDKGIVPPLLLEAPKRAPKSIANDFYGKTYLDTPIQSKRTQNLNSIITGASTSFISEHKTKPLLSPPLSKDRELPVTFFIGATGGLIGTAVNTPFDVVKSRIQGALKEEGAEVWVAYPALVAIAREKGVEAL